MHSIIFGEDDLSKFPPNVKFVHRFLSLFPTKATGAEESSLNIVDYKYLMVYEDHLSVFKAMS